MVIESCADRHKWIGIKVQMASSYYHGTTRNLKGALKIKFQLR
jgi:hypothetical protein